MWCPGAGEYFYVGCPSDEHGWYVHYHAAGLPTDGVDIRLGIRFEGTTPCRHRHAEAPRSPQRCPTPPTPSGLSALCGPALPGRPPASTMVRTYVADYFEGTAAAPLPETLFHRIALAGGGGPLEILFVPVNTPGESSGAPSSKTHFVKAPENVYVSMDADAERRDRYFATTPFANHTPLGRPAQPQPTVQSAARWKAILEAASTLQRMDRDNSQLDGTMAASSNPAPGSQNDVDLLEPVWAFLGSATDE